MSLRKGIAGDTPQPTAYALDEARMQDLFRVMTEVGVSRMSTKELEEWSYLMAQSLEGKGDPFVPIEEAHAISTEGPGFAV